MTSLDAIPAEQLLSLHLQCNNQKYKKSTKTQIQIEYNQKVSYRHKERTNPLLTATACTDLRTV